MTGQSHAQGLGNLVCNLLLYSKNGDEVTIVTLRLQVNPVGSANPLRSDAQLLAFPANAALEQVRHPELVSDRAHVFVPALELERGSARDNP
jgi:hypothetical protein